MQVLVLDKGALVEYDTPLALLQRSDSQLRCVNCFFAVVSMVVLV